MDKRNNAPPPHKNVYSYKVPRSRSEATTGAEAKHIMEAILKPLLSHIPKWLSRLHLGDAKNDDGHKDDKNANIPAVSFDYLVRRLR